MQHIQHLLNLLLPKMRNSWLLNFDTQLNSYKCNDSMYGDLCVMQTLFLSAPTPHTIWNTQFMWDD